MSTPASVAAGDEFTALPASPDTAAPNENDQPWFTPRRAWYGVGLVSLVTVFGQFDRAIMALLVSPIKHDTGMNDTQLSLLMGLAYSAVYMCVGLPMARVADVRRRTFLLPAALAVWSLGTILCGLAQSFASFFLFRGLVGGGEAVKGPTSTSLIADLVPRRRLGRAFGIYNVAVSVGEGGALILGGLLLGIFAHMAPIPVPGLGHLHGWRLVYLVFGLPGLILALVFVSTMPEPARHGRRYRGAAPIRDVALYLTRGPAARLFVPMFISGAMANIYLLGTIAWKPAFYERTYGFTPAHYGPIIGSVSLITAPIGVAIGSVITERMGRRWDDAYMRITLITDLLAIPVAVAAPLMPSFGWAIVAQAASSLLLMAGAPAKIAAQQLITPNEMRAQINAVMMFTVSVLGSGLGPTIVALLTDYAFRDESQLRYAMMVAAAIATPTSAICAWFGLRAYRAMIRNGLIVTP